MLLTHVKISVKCLFKGCPFQSFNPISTGLFDLVVVLGGVFTTPSIKFDPDILEH